MNKEEKIRLAVTVASIWWTEMISNSLLDSDSKEWPEKKDEFKDFLANDLIKILMSQRFTIGGRPAIKVSAESILFFAKEFCSDLSLLEAGNISMKIAFDEIIIEKGDEIGYLEFHLPIKEEAVKQKNRFFGINFFPFNRMDEG